jgi:hypothetical protein
MEGPVCQFQVISLPRATPKNPASTAKAVHPNPDRRQMRIHASAGDA